MNELKWNQSRIELKPLISKQFCYQNSKKLSNKNQAGPLLDKIVLRIK